MHQFPQSDRPEALPAAWFGRPRLEIKRVAHGLWSARTHLRVLRASLLICAKHFLSGAANTSIELEIVHSLDLATAAGVQCAISPGGSARIAETTRAITPPRAARRACRVTQQASDAPGHEARLPTSDSRLADTGIAHDLDHAKAVSRQ
jgi:hypothetical protein